MSVQASIEISYNEDLDILNVLSVLEKLGWQYVDDSEKISFLINDDFEWEIGEVNNLNAIKKMLKIRFETNKITGIIIFNKKGGEGCLFHFMPSKQEIMMLISIRRKKISDTNITDFSFYLDEIYQIIKSDCQIICNQIG
ncbi:hypothetical protein [Pedobacter sp. CFBP9032]|uniref:hypothetical protein n=1 Tax=Pedobacter sp. CFBP9032 TaxID=3096539 RepID=UPI002A6A0B9C|nr:hypothetical protein [Pedobacter sp. CFBP9032]MDY0907824.1 hypothetical protein [Pedobacter sp. CFBP9032]